MSVLTNTRIEERRDSYATSVAAAVLVLVLVRLVCAAYIPLASDEVLYWRYSRYLAPGYLDHPALNPFLIRIGTTLFGESPFGVRAITVLAALPASWAVWRAASILFKDDKVGATAALFFNLTIAMSVGSLLATSDSVVVVTSAFLLLALAKLDESGRGQWWLAVGAAFGFGMFAKYTTLFFAAGVLAWLLIVPAQRKWFRSPWPYAGAIVAALIFSPVLLWNAEHQWASIAYQSSRMIIRQWTLRYLFELIGSQIGMLTPPIFILACIGLFWGLRDDRAPRSGVVLTASLIAPALTYFAWHSLHERVQGNWPECVVPAAVCAAALAVKLLPGRRMSAGAAWAEWSKRAALPVGAVLAALVYAQAIFGVFPIGRHDPTARLLGGGWPVLASQIDEAHTRTRARVFLTTDYSLASALSYYLRSSTPVEQVNDRVRWAAEPTPNPALFSGTMIYVCKWPCAYASGLGRRFREVEYLGLLPRARNRRVIEQYALYRVAGPRRDTLDPMYPIRTKASDAYSF